MYNTRYLLAALLLCWAPAMARQAARTAPAAPAVAAPLTIGQLAEQARLRRTAEGSGAARGAPPPGLTIVPSTQIIGSDGAAPAPSPLRVARPAPPPEFRPALLGVYRKGGRYYVELAEQAGDAVFVQGQQTPSGWTVLGISARQVELGKPEAKGGGMRRVSLPVSDR